MLLENLTSLKAYSEFDRNSMDGEQSELAKQAPVSSVYALIALLLAAIGLYAVIAHSVSGRTKKSASQWRFGTPSLET